MKNLSLRGGHGLLLPIIGGRIGMARTVVHMGVRTVVAHIPKAQHITKDTLLIKSQDRGVEQVAMRMRVPHQEEDIVRHQAGLTVDMLVAGMLVDTVNQCGG